MLLIASIYKAFLDIFLEIIGHQNEVPLQSELQDLNHRIKVMLWTRNMIKASLLFVALITRGGYKMETKSFNKRARWIWFGSYGFVILNYSKYYLISWIKVV